MNRLSLMGMLLLVVWGMVSVASAQSIRLPPIVTQPQGIGSPPVTNGDDAQRQLAVTANAQRQIEIRRDTEKMAALTQELKEYLAKSDQGVMSVDAIKKAEQIEKLARSVKSKMKQAF